MNAGRSRRFELDDQRAFAALSGDWNPVHVDPVAARRTMFGSPIVHGIHLVCWALDAMLLDAAARQIAGLRATFPKPVHLGKLVTVTGDVTEHGARLRADTEDGLQVLELEVELGAAARELPMADEAWPDPLPARDVALDEVTAQAGEARLGLDPARLERAFPRLARSVARTSVAELLATTRVVGMECPGLHSLYSGLSLAAGNRGQGPLTYRVQSANLRYSVVKLAVEGPTLAGTLNTFYRPPPRPPLPFSAFEQRVEPTEFVEHRAVVIGGSRGLGEAFAKSIAAGGGKVCITYSRGETEARRVCDEIGARAVAMQLDVTRVGNLGERWPAPWLPTHVYYCATPFIQVDRAQPFSERAFTELAAYYVTGWLATLRALSALVEGKRLQVWAPSTVFLDNPERGAAAYCVAKAAMEELGRQLPELLPCVVRTPRVPRIATDQTASLVKGALLEPIDVALAELRAEAAPQLLLTRERGEP